MAKKKHCSAYRQGVRKLPLGLTPLFFTHTSGFVRSKTHTRLQTRRRVFLLVKLVGHDARQNNERSACCIIRKFPRDLRAADKKLSYAIANRYAKRRDFFILFCRFLIEIIFVPCDWLFTIFLLNIFTKLYFYQTYTLSLKVMYFLCISYRNFNDSVWIT